MACFAFLGDLPSITGPPVLWRNGHLLLVQSGGTAFERWDWNTLTQVDAAYAPYAATVNASYLATRADSEVIYYVGGPSGSQQLRVTVPGGSDDLIVTYDGSVYGTDWNFMFESGLSYSPADDCLYVWDESGAAPPDTSYGLFAVSVSDGSYTRVTSSSEQVSTAGGQFVVTSDGAVWWVTSPGSDITLHRYLAADGETTLLLDNSDPVHYFSTIVNIGVLSSNPTQVWVSNPNDGLLYSFGYNAGTISQAGADLCGGSFLTDPTYPYGGVQLYSGSLWDWDYSRFMLYVGPGVWFFGQLGGWRAGLGAQSQTPGWTVTQ